MLQPSVSLRKCIWPKWAVVWRGCWRGRSVVNVRSHARLHRSAVCGVRCQAGMAAPQRSEHACRGKR